MFKKFFKKASKKPARVPLIISALAGFCGALPGTKAYFRTGCLNVVTVLLNQQRIRGPDTLSRRVHQQGVDIDLHYFFFKIHSQG